MYAYECVKNWHHLILTAGHVVQGRERMYYLEATSLKVSGEDYVGNSPQMAKIFISACWLFFILLHGELFYGLLLPHPIMGRQRGKSSQ